MDEERGDFASSFYWRSLFLESGDPDERNRGLRMILRGSDAGDPEASFIVAELLLDGHIRLTNGSSEECAMDLLCKAADKGFLPARGKLNCICEEKYRKQIASISADRKSPAPLVDFGGRKIKIDRKGVLTPVDAKLEFKDGRNVLTLSANINLLSDDMIDNEARFLEAVISGIKEWEGDYNVFGNQKLKVIVDLTSEFRLFDCVNVVPVTGDFGNQLQSVTDIIGTKKRKAQISEMLEDKRSFATAGFKWSVYSRKIIFIQSKSGRFNEYDEISAVSKHEFGHVLGLGDLYESPEDSLSGVDKGSYSELDGYYITDKFYNLVMCDHHGPVSNNDIEMVVLAFSENKAQLYQPGLFKGKISTALGKGN